MRRMLCSCSGLEERRVDRRLRDWRRVYGRGSWVRVYVGVVEVKFEVGVLGLGGREGKGLVRGERRSGAERERTSRI